MKPCRWLAVAGMCLVVCSVGLRAAQARDAVQFRCSRAAAVALGAPPAGPVPECCECAGAGGMQTQIVPQCLFEWLSVVRSYVDFFIGAALSTQESPTCRQLATVTDALFIVESMMAYRICSLRYSEPVDEERIERLVRLRKTVLVVDEFLYIIELLSCYQEETP